MNLAVFDIDGTMVRPYHFEDLCFVDALRAVFDFKDVDSDWAGYTDVTDSGLVHQLCSQKWNRAPSQEDLHRFQVEYCGRFLSRVGPDDGQEVPGASSFVSRLREDPTWRVAVATGNFRTLAMKKLERSEIPCLDAPMATADDEISRAALVRLAVSRSEVAYGVEQFDHVVSIGDAPWDLRASRELSMPFVAIGPRCGTVPGRTIANYLDGVEVLERMHRAVCW